MIRGFGHAPLLVCSALLSGCLLTSSGDFPERAPTRPYLSSADATPPISSLVLVADGGTRPFRTQVASEDNGTPLQVLLVADWKTPQEILIQSTEVAAGSFDIARRIGADWTPGSRGEKGGVVAPGCHSFSLVVSHRFDRVSPTLPVRVDDYDFLTWWVLLRDLQDPTSDAALLGTCPRATDLTP
jgi:hypothetical protein